MRLGMRSSGTPLRFSEKIVAPLAIALGLPADWKNSSATAGSYAEFAELRELFVSKVGLPEIGRALCPRHGEGSRKNGRPAVIFHPRRRLCASASSFP